MAHRTKVDKERDRPKAHKYQQFVLRVPDELKEEVHQFIHDSENKTHIRLVPMGECVVSIITEAV